MSLQTHEEMTTQSEKTVSQWVLESPGRARLFELLGIDYCCGGQKPLTQACQEAGISPQSMMEQLMTFDQSLTEADQQKEGNWSDASITELVEHILEAHHHYLYRELPELEKLLDKVVKAHGEKHAELIQLRAVFNGLKEELLNHLYKEENVLFPYSQALDKAVESLPPIHCGHVGNPIQAMCREHDEAGNALKLIRTLTQNFTLPEDACQSYRVLFHQLEQLEKDLFQHIHKENNILFPAVLKKASTLS